jgi:hypothetical protein
MGQTDLRRGTRQVLAALPAGIGAVGGGHQVGQAAGERDESDALVRREGVEGAGLSRALMDFPFDTALFPRLARG